MARKRICGRIILSGTPGIFVRVALLCAKGGATGHQTFTIHTLSRGYRTFPLRYIADPDSENATLEITGTGTGEFYVGAVSLMSASPPERKNTL